MNELVSVDELSKALKMNGTVGKKITTVLHRFMKFPVINNIYKDIYQQNAVDFLTSVLDNLGVKYEIDERELRRIPATGAFVTVSNHPFGGLEGIILMHFMIKKRPDFKVMGNFLLHYFAPLKDSIIAVNPFEEKSSSNFAGMKGAIRHLEGNMPMGIFPAGEVSTYKLRQGAIVDRTWQKSAIKFIKNAKVPVIPIYFEGKNSRLFNILSAIHPILRTLQLGREMFTKKNQIIKIRIGNPIPPKKQHEFSDITQYSQFLRAKTYILGTPYEKGIAVKKKKVVVSQTPPEPVIPAVPVDVIEAELAKNKQHMLFQSSNFDLYLAPTPDIPNVMREIGRLREITFREVGEGTNKSIDIDNFDQYYNQLFMWDNQAKAIAGGYRIGKGKDILASQGLDGFYVNSLFRLKKGFIPYLNEGLEMGRSFITKEYQRKPNSLFLLWKGILYTLLKNPEYRYMFGPVSISNEFTEFSKSLIVDFIRKNHGDEELAANFKPKMPYKTVSSKRVNKDYIIQQCGNDISNLDEFIKDIEYGWTSPVLMKKYLKLNAKIISFNVDPDFNNCVDGLVVSDIFDYPVETIRVFAK